MHKTPREPRAALYVRDCAAPPFDAQSRRDLLDALLRKTRIRSVTAGQLLDRFGDLAGIFAAAHPEADPPEGLGPAVRDLFQLVAALHERHSHDLIDRKRDFLDSSQNTRNWLIARYRHATKEVFGVIHLTSMHHIIRAEEVFYGTVDAAAVYPREILRSALRTNAAALIIFHNHPSGVPEPSQADVSITRKLRVAIEPCDIRLLDHFVVGANQVVSLAERGLM